MTHTATWEEVAKLILKERGIKEEEVEKIYIKDGKIHVETKDA